MRRLRELNNPIQDCGLIVALGPVGVDADQALIAHLKLQIGKLNRDHYGQRSERTPRLLDQLELTLEELETAATEDELAAEMAAAKPEPRPLHRSRATGRPATRSRIICPANA